MNNDVTSDVKFSTTRMSGVLVTRVSGALITQTQIKLKYSRRNSKNTNVLSRSFTNSGEVKSKDVRTVEQIVGSILG